MNAPLASSHFPEPASAAPRFREAGEMTLDLFHRDARVDDRWLGLLPEEFALLWRLAAIAGERLTVEQLEAEAWHIPREPEPGGVAAHIARMRPKLAEAGVAYLICTDGEGRFFLEAPPATGMTRSATG